MLCRRFLLAILAAAALGSAARALGADGPAPARKPLDPKDRAKLVTVLKGYLDGESQDAYKHRINLQLEVKRLLQTGVDVLADPADLQAMCYAARPFRPVFDRRILPRDAKDAEIAVDSSAGVVNVAWDQLRLSLSLPAGYAELAKDARKLAVTAPYPVVVTMHELEDFQDAKGAKKFPGLEVIRRRWDRRSPATKAVADSCFVLAPVATRARFVEDGRVQPSRILDPLRETWQRYHADVDRVVLDGGPDALLAASCMANFLSGVIVRGDAADLSVPALLRNLVTLHVFVVGTEASAFAKTVAAAVEAGQFPKDRVTVGAADLIGGWLQKLPRREVPKSFRWVVADRDAQAFAHWAILQPDPAVGMAEFAAEVVDTAEDPNTIRLTAKGIVSATILLSDQFVSLDREVRIVANGVVVREARVLDRPGGRPVALPMKFERTVDGMFDNPELSVRKSLYYGLWSPVMLSGVEIPAEGAAAPAHEPPPPAGPVDEAEAERLEQEAQAYYAKAAEYETEGNAAKALDLYRKAAGLGAGETAQKAREKVKELEEAGGK